MKKTFDLSVIYNSEWFPDLDYIIEDLVGMESESSSAGFGERDLFFVFPSLQELNQAKAKLSRISKYKKYKTAEIKWG